MLMDIDNDFYDRILPVAAALNTSPEEYLQQQHDKNNNLKNVLLTEKDDFVTFVEEYKIMLDHLFYVEQDTMGTLNKVGNTDDMNRVFSRLCTLIGEDIGFITKLYAVYKEKEPVLKY